MCITDAVSIHSEDAIGGGEKNNWTAANGGVTNGGLSREEKNGVLAKRGLCPLPKTGGFDENGENDEWTLYPPKQGLCSSGP